MEEKERYEYFFGTNTIKDNINKEFLSYKRVIDTLNRQDKRIKELEEELKNYKLCRCVDCSSEYEYGLETSIDELEKENQQLKHQLAITEKALELACDYLVSNGNEDDELYKLVQNIYADDEYLATKINYFKTKAKEMLENE